MMPLPYYVLTGRSVCIEQSGRVEFLGLILPAYLPLHDMFPTRNTIGLQTKCVVIGMLDSPHAFFQGLRLWCCQQYRSMFFPKITY